MSKLVVPTLNTCETTEYHNSTCETKKGIPNVLLQHENLICIVILILEEIAKPSSSNHQEIMVFEVWKKCSFWINILLNKAHFQLSIELEEKMFNWKWRGVQQVLRILLGQ